VGLVRHIIGEVGRADRVIVNSRPDVAELLGCLGVHLPENGLRPRDVRAAFPRLMIGVSRHDRTGLEMASDEGADYALLGPVFQTPGKEFLALGGRVFERTIGHIGCPVLAVGGITTRTAAAIFSRGAAGVAAIRPFTDATTAKARAKDFRLSFNSSSKGDLP
jgi:thiamine-phosphate diphosphorylase